VRPYWENSSSHNYPVRTTRADGCSPGQSTPAAMTLLQEIPALHTAGCHDLAPHQRNGLRGKMGGHDIPILVSFLEILAREVTRGITEVSSPSPRLSWMSRISPVVPAEALCSESFMAVHLAFLEPCRRDPAGLLRIAHSCWPDRIPIFLCCRFF
jgi:hypothetical protein